MRSTMKTYLAALISSIVLYDIVETCPSQPPTVCNPMGIECRPPFFIGPCLTDPLCKNLGLARKEASLNGKWIYEY